MTARAPLTLLFDLDGTLIDSVELLLASMRHAFITVGLPVPPEDEWVAGIGTPLVTQLRQFAERDAQVPELVSHYRAYQREHHDELTRPFPGVVDTLRALRDAGHPTAIVTSKAEDIAHRSVAHVGLASFIDTVVGVESCTRHKPDPEPVHVALERLGARPADAIFLGDSPHDVASGNAAGVDTVAALWGPFPRPVLEAARPRHWLGRFDELPALVARLERRLAS